MFIGLSFVYKWKILSGHIFNTFGVIGGHFTPQVANVVREMEIFCLVYVVIGRQPAFLRSIKVKWGIMYAFTVWLIDIVIIFKSLGR